MGVDEHTIELACGPVFFRTAPAREAVTPVYLHTVPTSSDDWTGVLERSGGLAPDLIGFGRSAKGGHLDYTIKGLAAVVAELLDHLELDRVRLVGHGWGALVALELAAHMGERVPGLILIAPPPLLGTYKWRGAARLWRIPVLGELAMGSVTRALLARHLRAGGPWSDERVRAVWGYFDQGTQRAVLRLHRATPPDHLERCAGRVSQIVYGERDPWFTVEQAQAVAALFGTSTRVVPGAGHWPWLEQPDALP